MTAASPDWDDLVRVAAVILKRCEARGLRIATAESCTGGLIAGAFTEVPGSSSVFERGFVTYSNEAKSELLGVPTELLVAEGAVSEAVARAMAKGALRASRATLAVSVTGVAGPGGGSPAKPIGLVHFGGATERRVVHRVERFGDLDRRTIRLKSVAVALDLLAGLIEEEGVQATP